jgi:dihydropteroate synthase
MRRLDGIWPRRRALVMGVLNCTPDSFSDGGCFVGPDRAVRHALHLYEEGAEIVDVGGESTRPGARAVSAEEECERVVPVIAEIRRLRPHALISVDTSKAQVAEWSLEAGADVINDVRAAADPRILDVAAAHGAAVVLMHMRGTPRSMQDDTRYTHLVAEVCGFLASRAAAALDVGIADDRIWLDPGIGFGKDDEGNLQLLAALPDLAALGHPVVIGPSRKSFIGRLTGAPVDERLAGTLASLIPVPGIDRSVVRVHDPGPAVQFLEIASRLRGAAA